MHKKERVAGESKIPVRKKIHIWTIQPASSFDGTEIAHIDAVLTDSVMKLWVKRVPNISFAFFYLPNNGLPETALPARIIVKKVYGDEQLLLCDGCLGKVSK